MMVALKERELAHVNDVKMGRSFLEVEGGTLLTRACMQ